MTSTPVATSVSASAAGAEQLGPALFGLDRLALDELVADLGARPYRAAQLWRALYQGVGDFADMTTLPAELRAELAQRTRLHTAHVVTETTSADGLATKLLLRLADGQLIETVLMRYDDPADEDGVEEHEAPGKARHTVCLSTQAGCAMGCIFCATGQMGLIRDLTVAECVEQIMACQSRLRGSGRVDRVVFMGMGEPLANWPVTWAVVERLHDRAAFGLGARRITISTVGLVPGIHRLIAAPIPVRLAVSLHAADDALRTALVPVNDVYPLSEVMAACRAYQAARRRRITFEVVLIDGVNDSPMHAAAMARLLKGVRAHMNLIPLNPTEGSPHRPTPLPRAEDFQGVLRAAGIPTTLRVRRGIAIQAGCGQLRSRAEHGRMGRGLVAPVALVAS